MDILTIILACSLHFDDDLVAALVHKVSSDNPFLVGDLVTLETHDHLTTIVEAKAAVQDILRHGGRPAVGLLGIPVTWASRYGRSPDELFDACTNIAVGTAALSEYASQCSPRRRGSGLSKQVQHPSRRALERQRRCILRRLGDDLGASGFVEAVLPEISSVRSAQRDGDKDPPPASSSIVAPIDSESSAGQTTAAPVSGPTVTPLPTAQSVPRAR
jgi:hypothetical protein